MSRSGILLPATIVLLLATVLDAQQAGDLYQRGLVEEHARGRLAQAIAFYEQAASAAGADRALAARALVRAGATREKLKDWPAASATYASILRAYPEQRAEVDVARARLAALDAKAAAAPGPGLRTTATRGRVAPLTGPLFSRYCVRCHGPAGRAGGLDLDALDPRDLGTAASAWETVLARLRARRDPPAGEPRPDEATYRAIVARLEDALDESYRSTETAIDRAPDEVLAARLAALVWNAAPDAALLEDARQGRLRDRASLGRRVAVMLRDPRSAALVTGFLTSWLSLDRLSSARPDPALHPQADAELLEAMGTETRLFLESQLRDDRDAIDLWTASYTFMNERLARHYGVSGVTGRQFQRVEWPTPARAGLLGQAGPLTLLSFAARTSPTVRGRYVLSKFIGVDPPNPPANVPALAERPPAPAPMRDRLAGHRVNPSCASCHVMFDPIGFALENFDAIGAWRTTDGGGAIDTRGAFIDGTPFSGPASLRAGLLRYRDAYYTNLTRQLLAYALKRSGRAGRVYDYEMPAVRRVVRDAAADGYRWSALLAGIAASVPFQARAIVP